MDVVITLVRIPLALVAVVLIVTVHVVQFILETAAVMVCLPFAVCFMDRADLKTSWLSRYPQIIRHGYGQYDAPVEPDWHDQGCLIVLVIPFVLLIFLLFPRKGLAAGIANLFDWVFSDSKDWY